MLERTLVLVKPDAIRRALIGEVLSRIERTGLRLVGLKLVHVTQELAERHYTYEDIAVRHGEEIRSRLVEFIADAPMVAAAFEGSSAVSVVRKLAGDTEPRKAAPGTIRGDLCHHSFEHCMTAKRSVRNVIHASASPEEAARELSLWFSEDEFVDYRRSDEDEHRYL